VVELPVLHGLCGKREVVRTKWNRILVQQYKKARVENKAAVVPSSGFSEEFNLRLSKIENRAN